MQAVLIALALAVPGSAQLAAPLSRVYSAPVDGWLPVLSETLDGGGAAALGEAAPLVESAVRDGSAVPLAPALVAIESVDLKPAAFAALPKARRLALLRSAAHLAKSTVREEARFASRFAASASDAELPLAVSRLMALRGRLAAYLDADSTALVEGALKDASLKLPARSNLQGGSEEVSALAGAAPLERLRPVPSRKLGALVRLKLESEVLALRAGYSAKAVAAPVYRKALMLGQSAMKHFGELWRKYVSGREMDAHNWRWSVVETVHSEGDFRGSFGHPIYDGMPKVRSGLVFRAEAMKEIQGQVRALEAPSGATVRFSAMASISGMSFPQLSAQSHLSLMYMHLRLAKDQGARITFNTGEGGPGFHLALLEGDVAELERHVVEWNLGHQQFKPGSWEHAKVALFVRQLMAKRDEVLSRFTPEELAKAQIVAQFGSALNGIRNAEGAADYEKVRRVGASPYVAMFQYKLKQAAKRGAKVNASKIDPFVATMRETPKDRPFKSPEINPELDGAEAVARLIHSTRLVSSKPVSLKFGVGDPKDLLEFFEELLARDALPDHIQIDGAGEGFSPGSGNAPPGADTSMPLNEALIATDAVLKKLGIRDRIFVEATGDVLLPVEAVEKLALGADGVAGGRLWMGMGLGCAKVKSCANGTCPYGIASRSLSLMSVALDPARIGPKGYEAAVNWRKAYLQTLAETTAGDWRDFRKKFGLASGTAAIVKKKGLKFYPLDEFYDEAYVTSILRGAADGKPVLTPAEIRRHVFGRP